MPRKTREERAKYMRAYREKKMQEAVSLEGDELDRKLEEYRQQGLTQDHLFMDMVFRLAMQGNNAKYAELWWKMNKPEDPKEKELTAEDCIAIGMEVRDRLKAEYKYGACPICGHYTEPPGVIKSKP